MISQKREKRCLSEWRASGGGLKPLLLAEEQLTVGDSQSEKVGLKNLTPKQSGGGPHL